MVFSNNEDVKKIELQFPTYKETVSQISGQLSLRKKILASRIIFLIWPPLVAAISLVLTGEAYKAGLIDKNWEYMNLLLGILAGWLIFSLLYYYILSFVFFIEKTVWVDSFFDKKNLDPKDSWRIAKRLFWPSIRLRLEIFMRYVLPVVILFYLFVTQVFARLNNFMTGLGDYIIVAPLVISLIIGVYLYYIRVFTRYIPFIFLDRYGSADFSYSGIFKELRELKKIESTKTHTRTLLTHLTAGIFDETASVSLGPVQAGLAQFTVVGKVAGVVVRMIGEEAATQSTSIGKIVSVYMLYQFARQKLYGQSQHINEHLYSL